MTELTNDGSIVAEPSNRFEMSKRANELRKNGELEEALPLYRELVKDELRLILSSRASPLSSKTSLVR